MSSDFEREIENYDCLWSKQQEEEVIQTLQLKGIWTDVKNGKQINYIRAKFKLVSIDGITKVAQRKDNRIMATKQDVSSIIKKFYFGCDYQGQKKTYKKISELYVNITMAMVTSFTQKCKHCVEKMKKYPSEGSVFWPITANELKQRGHIDLIDFQNLPDDEFKFILQYQEHETKFVFLMPLKSKTALDVAKSLLSIFLQFRAPHVLQSTNGREFTAEVIKELASIWTDLILINGIETPQSKDSIRNVKESIIKWMRENESSSWSIGISFVQWKYNTTYNQDIEMKPYEAFFGHKPRPGLKSKIRYEFQTKIKNGIFEEEILETLEQNQCQGNVSSDKTNENENKDLVSKDSEETELLTEDRIKVENDFDDVQDDYIMVVHDFIKEENPLY